MRLFVLLAAFLCASGLYAQKTREIEPAVLECQYAHWMLRDTLNPSNRTEDLMILRIGKNASEFFSRYTFYGDSLWNDPQGEKTAARLTLEAVRTRDHSRRPGSRTTNDYIYKNYPKGKMSTYTSLGGISCHLIQEDMPEFEWEMRDSSQVVCGYTCQLAVTRFRGRNWNAWFTLELPVSDGPWKLGGLPGLILEAYDAAGHYHYTLVGIRKKDVPPVTFYNYWKKKYEKTERLDFLRMEVKSLNDPAPMRTIKEATGIDYGVKYDPNSERRISYDLLERDYR